MGFLGFLGSLHTRLSPGSSNRQLSCPVAHNLYLSQHRFLSRKIHFYTFQVRRRHCSNPTPTNGGRYCQGKDMNSRPCTSGLCRPNLAVSRDLPVITDPDQDTTIATSDLTLYIGLAVAFLIFVLVVFIIVRLLQRKRNPHPSYSYTPAGERYRPLWKFWQQRARVYFINNPKSILSIPVQIFCQHS